MEARLGVDSALSRRSATDPSNLAKADEAYTAQGRKLVANVDHREGNLLHLRLIDPTDPNAADDPLACLNADLVREGK